MVTVQPGETNTARGKVTTSKTRYIRRNFNMQEVVIDDGTGEMKLIWFNQPYIVTSFAKVGAELAVAGKAEKQGKKLTMKPLEYEKVLSAQSQVPSNQTTQLSNVIHELGTRDFGLGTSGKHTGKIVPIYSQRGGLSTRLIREKIDYVLKKAVLAEVREGLPEKFFGKNGFNPYAEPFHKSQPPDSRQVAKRARSQLPFEDLFPRHQPIILFLGRGRNQEIHTPLLTTCLS